MFRLDNETATYGTRSVLSGVTLSIGRGEKVALVGESGAGKTTLLRLLRAQQEGDTAWCPQEHGLVLPLSVFHNVFMGQLDRHSSLYNLRNLLLPVRGEVVAVEKLLHNLGMGEWLWSSVDKLSGGQQQRVAVARALFSARCTFLGDEPVSAVDEYQGRAILDLVMKHHETVVLALHDIELALATCSRIIGLQEGKIVLDAPAAELSPQALAPLYRHHHG
jgi:phosphonate transport system ATP-binding protein